MRAMTTQEPSGGDLSVPARTDTEANARYDATKTSDPFPSIAPSLLNSADICDYVRVTGMLFPFDEGKLKSASYEAALGGECIVWDASGEKKHTTLTSSNDTFTLKANSIAFVEVEPFFRLPDYIALRFNLKITHVHRGILLGTGPLVDPGYQGRLLIPLHNLTTNDYVFAAGEGLIWIEFTKTSSIKSDATVTTTPFVHSRVGKYRDFPTQKTRKKPIEFLHKAWPGGAIQSSIPAAVQEAKSSADKAQKSIAFIRNIGFVVGGLSLAALLYQQWSLTQDSVSLVKAVYDKLHDIEKGNDTSLEEMRRRLRDIERTLQSQSGVSTDKSDDTDEKR